MSGAWLIRATAILAAVCYAGRILLDRSQAQSLWRWQSARIIWTAGALLLALHVLCAFHFQHGWSHVAAWDHTRQRTLELTGWNSGAGVWANYAITVLWLIDAAGWWTGLDWPRRHRRWFWLVQLMLAFMMLNATAVFGPLYWLPIVAGCFVLLGVGLFRRRSRD